MAKKDISLPLIELDFTQPQGPTPKISKIKPKGPSMLFILSLLIITGGLVIFMVFGQSITQFFVSPNIKWSIFKQKEKALKTEQKIVTDTTSQSQKVISKDREIIPGINKSMEFKDGLALFLSDLPTKNITAIYSLDDPFIYIEGKVKSESTIDEIRAKIDTGIIARNSELLNKTSGKGSIEYSLRINKRGKEIKPSTEYISIPPYKRMDVIQELNSILTTLKIKGEFKLEDEIVEKNYSQSIIILDTSLNLEQLQQLLDNISSLPYFVQISSLAYEITGRGGGRLIMRGALNYSKLSAQTALNTDESDNSKPSR